MYGTPDQHPSVAVIRLNRPDVRNALRFEDIQALRTHFKHGQLDDAIRVVVITGTDGNFCSGADLGEMLQRREAGSSVGPIMREWAGLLTEFLASPKPVVVAVDGPCAGGGIQLAICSDVCLISTRGYLLNSPGLKIGMPSSELGTLILPAVIGWKRAKAMSLLSSKITASEAVDLGLCHEVFGVQEFDDRVMAVAEVLAERDPFAIAATKQALNQAVAWGPSLLNLTTLGAIRQVDERGVSWRTH